MNSVRSNILVKFKSEALTPKPACLMKEEDDRIQWAIELFHLSKKIYTGNCNLIYKVVLRNEYGLLHGKKGNGKVDFIVDNWSGYIADEY